MKKAFSILEIVIVVAILVVILGTIVMLLTSGKRSFSKSSSKSKLQNDAITIKQIYENEIRNCVNVNILSEKPDVLDNNKGYIFIDSNEDTIMIKDAGSSEVARIMYKKDDVKQELLFEKINNNTISTQLILKGNNDLFDAKTNMEFKMLEKNSEVVGSKGNCLEFNYDSNSVFLKQFIFSNDINEHVTSDSIGLIDEVNKTVFVNAFTHDITNLKPNISIFGKEVAFDSKDNEKYDILNPMPLDFTNPRQIYVFKDDDTFNQYTIKVIATPVESSLNLSIIPLKEKNDNPTKKNNVTMPTESSYLYAQFDETKEYKNYTINWYSVDEVSDIYKASDNWQFITSTKDRILDVSKFRENTLGKFVFFELTPKNGSDLPSLYSVEPQYLINKELYTPYVYVQLDYGNIWETTLNEIDYMMDRTINLSGLSFDEKMIATYGDKVEAIENAYKKAPSFRDEYEKYDSNGFTLIGEKIPNRSKFSGNIKSIIMDSTEFTYKVDYLKKDVRVQGNRQGIQGDTRTQSPYLKAYRLYPNATNDYGESALEVSHYAILSVDRYNDYYEDKSKNAKRSMSYTQNNGVRVGIVNTKTLAEGYKYADGYEVLKDNSYKDDTLNVFGNLKLNGGYGELGGFAISPNSTVTVDANDRRLYSTGYFYEFNLYPQRIAPLHEVVGVNMYDIENSKPTDNYLNYDNYYNSLKSPSIGALSSRNEKEYYYTPYSLNDINNDNAFYTDKNEQYYGNYTVDIFTKRKNNKMPIVEVDMYRGTNIKSEDELKSRKSKTMFFGDFTQYEGDNPYIDKVNNTYDGAGSYTIYGANTSETVTTKTQQGDEPIVMMDYNSKMNQDSKRNLTITAWSPTLNRQDTKNGTGNLDFLITDINTLNTER